MTHPTSTSASRSVPLLGLLALMSSPAHAGVVIHELLADPGSAVDANCDGYAESTNDEFVEILNTGPGSVDLSYGTLEDGAAGSETVRHTFPAGTVLGELESVVVFANGAPALDGSATGVADWCVDVSGRSLVQVAGSLSLNNSGDTVTVRDSGGAVLDTVTYGSEANDDQSITLDPEVIGTSWVKHSDAHGALASPGSLGATMGPFEVIIDTGSPTTGGGGCDGAAASQGVVINEFLVNPPSTDDGFEWVELFNGTNRDIDMSGWLIASGTSTFGPGAPFPGGTTLLPGEHFVVGQSGKAAAVVHLVNDGWSLGNASNADAVRLEDCNGNVVDTVVYGADNENGWLDDNGDLIDSGAPNATTPAPAPGEGQSAGRVPNGEDTNDSGADFIELPIPTPGDANDVDVESPCGGADTRLVINEFIPNPEGDDGVGEWVELYHAGSQSIDLTGWQIIAGTSSYSTFHTFEGGILQPGEHFLIGGEEVDNVDQVKSASGSLGNATSNSDAVRLLDCAGFPADTVIYGSPNDDDAWVDDTGEIATRTAPSPGEGSSLQRVEDGYDTDDSQADFAETSLPTPGETNPEIEPVVCVPSAGTVVINEFIPDPEGADEGYEWVELYNLSDEPVSVAGWGISAATSEFGSADITFPGDAEVPARGWLVVGGEGVIAADIVLDFSLGNGTGGDGLRLFDCDGVSVDTVVYGEPGNADGIPDDRGAIGEVYGEPGSAESMARVTDGVDADIAEDWTITAVPTPGASNARADNGGGGGSTTPLGVGCGWGKNADKRPPPDIQREQPAPKKPQAFCSSVPGPLQLFLPLVAVGLLRRRR